MSYNRKTWLNYEEIPSKKFSLWELYHNLPFNSFTLLFENFIHAKNTFWLYVPHCFPLTLARTHQPIFLPTSILFSLFFYYNIGYFSVPLVMPIYAGCRVIHWATTNHIPKLKWVSFLQLQRRPWEPLPFPPRELNQLRVLFFLPLCFNVLKSRNSRFVGNSLQNTLFL